MEIKILKIEAQEEELKDTLATIARSRLAQKGDQNCYKKLSLKNTFYIDKHSNNFPLNMINLFHG